MNGSLNSFLMDEQLEPINEGDEQTKLKLLKPHRAGDDIELLENVYIASPVSENEVVAFEAALIDLNDIEHSIRTNGMSQSIALEMTRLGTDMVSDTRPISSFSSMPSKVNAGLGLESILNKRVTIVDALKDKFNQIYEWLVTQLIKAKTRFMEIYDRYSFLFLGKIFEFDAAVAKLMNAVKAHYTNNSDPRKAKWFDSNRKNYIKYVAERETVQTFIHSEDARVTATSFKALLDNAVQRARVIERDGRGFGGLEKLKALSDTALNKSTRDVVPNQDDMAYKYFITNVASLSLDPKELMGYIDRLQSRFNKSSVEVNSIDSTESFRRASRYMELVYGTVRELQAVNSLYALVRKSAFTFIYVKDGETMENSAAFKNAVKYVEENFTIS